MNRAFVKEADGDDVIEPLYERQHSDLPNYITPEGLLHLKNRIRALENSIDTLSRTDTLEKKSQIARAQRDLRYLLERVHRAQPVTHHQHQLKRASSASLLYLKTKQASRTVLPWLVRTKPISITAESAGQPRLGNSSVGG